MIVTGLVAEPLDTAALVARIRRPDCGGLCVFEGSTRSPNEGREVVRMFYEAYDVRAEAQLRALASEAMERWSLGGVVAVHRTGDVQPGEPSVLVAAAAAHRAEAFEGARWLIDQIKSTVAVWKKEIFADAESWAGIPE
jgi:molybdopterin synthase catalytic subunit